MSPAPDREDREAVSMYPTSDLGGEGTRAAAAGGGGGVIRVQCLNLHG